MRPYELIVIFPTEEEFYRAGKEAVAAEIRTLAGEVVSEEEMGDRALTYPVKNRERGRYVLFNIKLAPDRLIAAEKVYKLNTNVLKYLFVRVDEKK
ncbi:MAG: 30S ribosomal protein S6 [Spirochaetes bacterium GWD1_61_31]|nr:MAG: 30S ribosomal protein S6 [Spirochaetes bacterium GWB1_60_80]OHD37543.1 MAG: 30S ribosomal protein S6 [Spirochaetes bacterium GWD1_61_31]OHD41947.1 MAG: 30S ribosomal protein S6 [Spirochaetes bacterium GWE1_60_18]OHD61786.1 MAG: 30S ribosomal protein S6 [Spirochaetes bacterium GWF1_60_12]